MSRAIVPYRGHRVSVMDVDNGGAGGDVVVIADMPLRNVDQMMVAEAARCVGHASQAEVGAIGENACQQRRFVSGRIAGAQMGEAIGKSGPSVDITQNLGDPERVNDFETGFCLV
jgi:hypothetical protein